MVCSKTDSRAKSGQCDDVNVWIVFSVQRCKIQNSGIDGRTSIAVEEVYDGRTVVAFETWLSQDVPKQFVVEPNENVMLFVWQLSLALFPRGTMQWKCERICSAIMCELHRH